ADSLTQFDGIKGRYSHEAFYEEKACDSCHLNK
nr:RecName: Full=Cytochrome c3, 10 kDa [Desulfuromonas acetoxidans]